MPDEKQSYKAYSGEIQIKLIARGDCFYDVTKIKDITNGTAGQTLIKAAGSVSDTSNNIIPDFPEKVNSEVKYSRKSGSEDIDSESDLRYNKKNSYTDDEYHAFGWARENDILTSTENSDLRSKFAAAVTAQAKPPKSKSGEYMISVGEDVENKIAYMNGTIDNPVITRVLEIDIQNETELDKYRRSVYDFERRGIQQKAGKLFRLYRDTDFGGLRNDSQRGFRESTQHSKRIGAYGSGSGRKASRIKEIIFGDDGEIISETRYSRKAPADTVTISKGEMQKRKANFESDKVYSRAEVERVLKKIDGINHLPSEMRAAIYSDVWNPRGERKNHGGSNIPENAENNTSNNHNSENMQVSGEKLDSATEIRYNRKTRQLSSS